MAGQTFSEERYNQPLQISLSIREWCDLVQGIRSASNQTNEMQTVATTITNRLPDFAKQAVGAHYQTSTGGR